MSVGGNLSGNHRPNSAFLGWYPSCFSCSMGGTRVGACPHRERQIPKRRPRHKRKVKGRREGPGKWCPSQRKTVLPRGFPRSFVNGFCLQKELRALLAPRLVGGHKGNKNRRKLLYLMLVTLPLERRQWRPPPAEKIGIKPEGRWEACRKNGQKPCPRMVAAKTGSVDCPLVPGKPAFAVLWILNGFRVQERGFRSRRALPRILPGCVTLGDVELSVQPGP